MSIGGYAFWVWIPVHADSSTQQFIQAEAASRLDLIQAFGDVVNTRQPASFKIRRKTDDDDVETQDARSTNVQVPLNQHILMAARS